MLTAVGKTLDRHVVVLGLTYSHMMGLLQGATITMALDGFDPTLPKVTVLVLSGLDEEAMAARMVELGAGADVAAQDMRFTDRHLPPISDVDGVL